MSKAYLFVYNDTVGTRDEIRDVLDSMQCVYAWRYDIPNNFYIVSDLSAQELYDEFTRRNGKRGRFMFMEASTNRQGMMPADTWHLLRHKSLKQKDNQKERSHA